MQNSIKGISAINPAIMENMEHSIVKARTDLKVDVLLDHYASFRFKLFKHFGQHSKQRVT